MRVHPRNVPAKAGRVAVQSYLQRFANGCRQRALVLHDCIVIKTLSMNGKAYHYSNNIHRDRKKMCGKILPWESALQNCANFWCVLLVRLVTSLPLLSHPTARN
jgi:hypothetical protein